MTPRGLFVTGTDTGVGKTEIACALVRAVAQRNVSVVGMKPVAAGARRVNGRLMNADVAALQRESTIRLPRLLVNPYLLEPPIAPHLAAREAGTALELGVILRAYRALTARAQVVIVEGAGGFRVPLDTRHDMSDLALRLRLPIVLVVGVRLGCISHALLAAEAIARRGLELAGWVANRIDPRMRRYRDTVSALSERLLAPLVADVPYVAGPRARAQALDRAIDGAWLARWLRDAGF